jgi:nicotinate-nucleotide pyrophosphorylase
MPARPSLLPGPLADPGLIERLRGWLAEDIGRGDLTAPALLAGERTAPNLAMRLSGIATATAASGSTMRPCSRRTTWPGPVVWRRP